MALHPLSVQNPYLRHLLFWCTFLPFLSLLLTPVFTARQDVEESEMATVALLHPAIDEVHQSANRTFTAWFIATGAMATSQRLTGTAADVPAFAAPLVRYANDWINGVWHVLYRAIWRFYALKKVLLMVMLLCGVPAAVDGLMVRARKQYRFQNSKPLYFYSALHAFILVFGLMFSLPFSPFPLSRLLLSLLLAVVILAAWVAGAHLQTGR